MDIRKDFRKYAKGKGVKNGFLDSLERQYQNFVTPYILEERQMNVTQMDVFSRLMGDRIIYFSGEVTPEACDTVIAQLLYLASIDDSEIKFYINSPGGVISSGLGVIDTMDFIKPDISTICIGQAASMGSVFLSNGTKGKRYVLPRSEVMIHSAAGGFEGHTKDIIINLEHMKREEDILYHILAENCGKTVEEIRLLCDRDNWFYGSEAVDILHIADKVITKES